jgi:hypothetical protein
MRVQATGPGRRGSLADGVGKLSLSQASGFESKQLQMLYEEIRDGNLGFWTALMWAYKAGIITKAEERQLDKLFVRIQHKAMEAFGE